MAETNAVAQYIKYMVGGGDKNFTTSPTTDTDCAYKAIKFVTDGNLTSLVMDNFVNDTALTSATTFEKGTLLVGNITKFITKQGDFILFS